MNTIRIFNIQRMTIHDGPGMRTTVFLKGCNLKCAWCHNPESQEFEYDLSWNSNKCIACGECVNYCLARQGGIGSYEPSKCNKCMNCVKNCPAGAIEQIGMDVTSEFIENEILKDIRLYEISGGGVTFSGGEPLLQYEQLLPLLSSLKEKGIHIAIDTAGNLPWSVFERVMSNVDLFLYDIKTADSQIHMKYTGVNNDLIIDNLMKLSDSAAVVIRIPLIDGVNIDEMGEICNLISKTKVKNVQLLKYHNIGKMKYSRLGKTFREFSAPNDEAVSKIKYMFEQAGIIATI